jgi:hypothetical protein
VRVPSNDYQRALQARHLRGSFRRLGIPELVPEAQRALLEPPERGPEAVEAPKWQFETVWEQPKAPKKAKKTKTMAVPDGSGGVRFVTVPEGMTIEKWLKAAKKHKT